MELSSVGWKLYVVWPEEKIQELKAPAAALSKDLGSSPSITGQLRLQFQGTRMPSFGLRGHYMCVMHRQTDQKPIHIK